MFSWKWKDNNTSKTAAIQSLDNLYFTQCLTSFFFIDNLRCRYVRNWLLNLNLIWKTLWTGAGNGMLISMLKKFNWFCLIGLMALVLLMWKWMGLLLRKNDLLRCWGWFSLLNWIGDLILSLLLKLPPRKLEPCFVLWSSFLQRLLYIYKFTIPPCREYSCHFLIGALSCYLELLDKLQKRLCRIVDPSLAASLEPLAHYQNVAILTLFYRYYFGRCSSELAKLVPLPYSWGRSTRYFHRLHDFLSPFLDVTRMSMSTVWFLTQLDSGILCL